jgi:Fic family protein
MDNKEIKKMKFLSVAEFAEKWGLTPRRVRQLCAEGKIAGVTLMAGNYLIPEDTKKPADGRVTGTPKPGAFEIIDELKKQINKCRPLTQGETERFNEEFLIEFTHNSNAIEGNTLTLRETALVLQGVTIDQKPLKDHMEAIGHRDAFYYVLDIVKNKEPFTESTIKKIHSLVLMDKPDDRGVYRKVPVRIGGSTHTPPQPYMINKLMEDLMFHMEEWKKTKNTVEQVALFHLEFESIHPFIDGNGRTGRLILNLMLMQQGYPPINIKYSNRMKYYACFEDYGKTENPKAMIKLITKLLETEMKKYLKRFE